MRYPIERLHRKTVRFLILLAGLALLSGCVVVPRGGYWAHPGWRGGYWAHPGWRR